MKYPIWNLLWMSALPLSAAEVGTLNTFTAGTPAKAAEVNQNFNDVKSAINENYQRLLIEEGKSATQSTQINELQTAMPNKQNKLTGSCAVGNTITSFNTDGTFNCAPIVLSGIVSVSSPSYVHESDSELRTGQCNIRRYNSLTLSGTSYTCTLYAPLDLPHAAQLTSLTCNMYDNLAGTPATVSVALQRVELFDDGPLDLLNVASAQGASVQVQTATDDTVTPGLYTNIIDNGFYAYRLKAVFESDVNGAVNLTAMAEKLRLYGCEIAFVAQPNGVPEH